MAFLGLCIKGKFCGFVEANIFIITPLYRLESGVYHGLAAAGPSPVAKTRRAEATGQWRTSLGGSFSLSLIFR